MHIANLLFLLASLASGLNGPLGVLAGKDRTFDYVVVGGGTAGLVVASRLTEDPSVTVAVIEAGIHHVNEPLVDTPEFFGRALANPDFDWTFFTTPQPELNDQVLLQSRGKMLGGSSGLNFMAYGRASAKEYDAWEELGATGWNFSTLLPYFKKSETVSPPTGEGIFPGAAAPTGAAFEAVHGRTGPLQPSYNDFYSNVTAPYVETLNGLGVKTNSDPYTGQNIGIANSELTIDRVKDVGKRSYSASTYFNISKSRPNFHVFLSTFATKIVFSNEPHASQHLKATGVEVMALNASGISGLITAKKDVILSAGAYQTPQLLELSGIGNKDILSSVGIDVLVDLPGVGENLQDHLFLQSDFELVDDFLTFDILRNNATFLAEQEAQYNTSHTGLLAAMNSALSFVPSSSIVPSDAAKAIQDNATSLAHSTGLPPLTQSQYATQLQWLLDGDVADVEIIMYPGGGLTALTPSPNTSYITISAAIVHPFGRGSVHINTSVPTAPPLINPNYLDNDVDLRTLLEAIKFCRKVAESQPIAPFVVGPHDPPASSVSDDDFLAFLRASASSVFHPAGTAPMVPQAQGGVVDPETLIVYGTTNLRVADASLVPLHIAAHLQATVYAIAERASDLIRSDGGCH